jgi:hypothetical protein
MILGAYKGSSDFVAASWCLEWIVQPTLHSRYCTVRLPRGSSCLS